MHHTHSFSYVVVCRTTRTLCAALPLQASDDDDEEPGDEGEDEEEDDTQSVSCRVLVATPRAFLLPGQLACVCARTQWAECRFVDTRV